MTEENNKKVNGIVEFDGYIFWTKAEVVKPYIIKYLKEKFPDSLILQEFNRIDMTIPGENLPIEIQSTIVNPSPLHAVFENNIRKQIEDNIENYDRCWFFFDSEYLKYLQNENGSKISINLDWMTKYIKENKLMVFIISHEGIIRETNYKDFDFIKRLSNTCKLSYEDDKRILNRNKLKIINIILKGYNFTQIEIDNLTKAFENSNDERFSSFLSKSSDRAKLFGNIINSMSNLDSINSVLDMSVIENISHAKLRAKYLGIFEIEGWNTKFIDKLDICKYFPGYVRNKEKWDNIKGHSIKQIYKIFGTKNDKSLNEY